MSLDLRRPLPAAEEIEAVLRRAPPKEQAGFLRAVSDLTRRRLEPALRTAVARVFPRPVSARTAAEARRAVHLAHLYFYWSEPRAARRWLAAAAAARPTGVDGGLHAWVEAKISLAEKDLTGAYRAFRRADALLDERRPLERGRFCGTFGLFYRQIGEPEKARWWLREGIRLQRAARDLGGEGILLGNLGQLERELGRYAAALKRFHRNLGIARRVGDVFGEILNLVRIAEIQRQIGRAGAAVRWYRAAVRVGARHPEQTVVHQAMLGLARIRAQEGRLGEARAWLGRARARVGRPRGRLRIGFLTTEARIARHADDFAAARRALARAWALARTYRDSYVSVRVLYDRARTELAAGREVEGRRFLLRALRLAEEAQLPESIVWCEQRLAERFPADLASARLSRYLGREKTERILRPGAGRRGGGRKTVRTILAGDLRGFTRLAERLPAARVVRVLNRYLDAVTRSVDVHGGSIDKFMGDGFLAVFGGTARGAAAALRAARAVRSEIEDLDRFLRSDLGDRRLGVGFGLDRGPVVEGEVGSTRRFDWTVIGDAVNVAARVQALAGAGEIVATAAVLRPLGRAAAAGAAPAGAARLRGRGRSVRLFRLEAAS